MKLAPAHIAWVALAGVLLLGALAVGVGERPALDWRPALAAAEPWRAWTAAAVHLSTLHLWANMAGLVVVTALGVVAGVGMASALAWAMAWPLTHVGLLLRPDLLVYGGASGVLHAGVAVVAWHLLRNAPGQRRWVGAAIAIGLALKIAGEDPFGPALRSAAGFDIAVAPFAHLSGAVAGIAGAVLAPVLARMRGHA